MDDHVVVLVTVGEGQSKMPCCISQGQLIGTRCIVGQHIIFLFSDDCVCQCQNFDEVGEVGILRPPRILDALRPIVVELAAHEVDICDAWLVLDRQWVRAAVRSETRREHFELHDVLR